MLPCFFCRQCGICGCASILAAVPDGPKVQGQSDSDSAAPRLDRSLFVRLTDSRLVQAAFLVLSCAVAVATVSFGLHRDGLGTVFTGRPLFSAAFVAFACGWLFQSIVVLWGIKAAKHVVLAPEGTECPMDPNALANELRGLAFAFAPKLLPTMLFGMGLVCLLPLAVVSWLHSFYINPMDIQGSINLIALFVGMPGAMVACECVLTAMTCRFILEAFLVASTAKSLVKVVHDELKGTSEPKEAMNSVELDHLKRVHVACGRLAYDDLPKLRKMSKPILGLVAFKTICACCSVVPVVFILALDEGMISYKMLVVVAVLYILSDLLLGLLCLMLPASVSDACADLVKELNVLRVRPFKPGLEVEVGRDSSASASDLPESGIH